MIDLGTGVDDTVEVLNITISVIHSAPSMAVLGGQSTLHTRDVAASIVGALTQTLVEQNVPAQRVCSLVISAQLSVPE